LNSGICESRILSLSLFEHEKKLPSISTNICFEHVDKHNFKSNRPGRNNDGFILSGLFVVAIIRRSVLSSKPSNLDNIYDKSSFYSLFF
jgi:hypothetical protein